MEKGWVLSLCPKDDKDVSLNVCVCVVACGGSHSMHLSSYVCFLFVTVCLCVCVSVKGILTDAGAEVSILVGPVVVGVAVVAAHRLQLDLLDLHGLCDGGVGSCCRRRCQAWRERGEETERLQNATCLLGPSHCHLANKKTKWKKELPRE